LAIRGSKSKRLARLSQQRIVRTHTSLRFWLCGRNFRQFQVGETQPSAETIQIQPNAQTEINQIQINIPLLNLGNFIPIFTKLSNNQKTGSNLRLDVRTEINGQPVEKQINYQV
jgi:hypothetical protein